MREHGIEVLEVPVGDRYVLEALADEGLTLGGEQSGHVIFADLATTGDGLLTAVQLLDAVHRSGQPLGDAGRRRHDAAAAGAAQRAGGRQGHGRHRRRWPTEIAAVEAELGDHGRVLVRGSGTEPLVRVMVEAPTAEAAEAAAARLVAAVEALGAD